MVEEVSRFRVFLASPGNVEQERSKVESVKDEINSHLGREKGFFLDLWRWETDSYPQLHLAGPQGAIDDQAQIQRCDILIGIFWTRFGTPTDQGTTGTEHEINLAYSAWKERGKPQVMLYFKEEAYLCTSKHETDQWGRVLEYRSSLKHVHYGVFKTLEEFESKLRGNLFEMVRSLTDPTIRDLPPGSHPVSVGGVRPPALIEFVNRSNEKVSLHWVEPSGKIVRYSSLPPGQTYVQPTFVGHAWVALNEQGKVVSAFKARVANSRAEIN